MTEKWQWKTDLTHPDEFDDAEKAEELSQKVAVVYSHIGNGGDWLREEERVGRWLGLALAIIVWGIVIVAFAVCHG
jgi:hypothetical protein